MLAHGKLRFATLAAAATLLTLVANASARNFSTLEREFEWTWSRLEFNAAGNTIACPITTLGDFLERTFPKIAGAIGVVKHTVIRFDSSPPCSGGTLTILTEQLPWRITYVSFGGRLPEYERIRVGLIGVGFRVSTGGFGCLGGTTSLKPAFAEFIVNRTTHRVEALRVDETIRIPLGGSFICEIAGEASLRGSAEVWPLPLVNSYSIELI